MFKEHTFIDWLIELGKSEPEMADDDEIGGHVVDNYKPHDEENYTF